MIVEEQDRMPVILVVDTLDSADLSRQFIATLVNAGEDWLILDCRPVPVIVDFEAEALALGLSLDDRFDLMSLCFRGNYDVLVREEHDGRLAARLSKPAQEWAAGRVDPQCRGRRRPVVYRRIEQRARRY
jgi:hypothetical protein